MRRRDHHPLGWGLSLGATVSLMNGGPRVGYTESQRQRDDSGGRFLDLEFSAAAVTVQ